MKVVLAKNAGFCFGVDRAVKMTEKLIDETDKEITFLGQIIHNPTILSSFERRGVKVIEDPYDAKPDNAVIIRAHGVTKETYDILNKKKATVYDFTCPFVKKIHNIVTEVSNKGQPVIIAGSSVHPEVKGIAGYANEYYFVENLEQLIELLENNDSLLKNESSLVYQTTFSVNEQKKINEYVKKHYTNINIFDTICSTTDNRQKEAVELAKKVDAMIIIGGRKSCNTIKLYELCKSICSNSYLIETADELDLSIIRCLNIIGVTAGASTPESIIREVILKMMESTNANTEFNFEEALEKSLRPISNGDIVKGTVISVSENEVEVDLGTKQAGYIHASEFGSDCSFKVGDEIDVQVVRLNDVEGTIQLSTRRVEAAKARNEIYESFKNNTVLEGKIVDVVNGGVIAEYKSNRVFIPASQTGVRRDGDLSVLVGTKQGFKIIDIQNGRRRRTIGSIRKATFDLRDKAYEEIFSDMEVGKKYNGVVKSITGFGAFVDIGGVDGMIHITDLSWSRIKHPSEVINVGDNVTVYVKEFDKEKRRISLGYKDPDDNPFEKFKKEYNVGDEIDVTVARILPFGAFAEIVPGIDGLIHISQISNKRVNKIHDFIKPGDVVKVKITQIDDAASKISLSIKALLPEEDIAEDVSESANEETVTDEGAAE